MIQMEISNGTAKVLCLPTTYKIKGLTWEAFFIIVSF